jgi:hypothetical protein
MFNQRNSISWKSSVYRNGVTELTLRILAADGNYTTLPLNLGWLYTVGNNLSVTQTILVFYKLLKKKKWQCCQLRYSNFDSFMHNQNKRFS